MRLEVKGVSLGDGTLKLSIDALVGHPSIKSRFNPADIFLQKPL
jgi:hypothetical protein